MGGDFDFNNVTNRERWVSEQVDTERKIFSFVGRSFHMTLYSPFRQ